MSKSHISTTVESPRTVEIRDNPDSVIAFEVSRKMNEFVDKLADKTIDTAMKAVAAREFLDWHTDHVRVSWLSWKEESSKLLEDIRQSRVAIEFESRHLLQECADVRKFFLSDQHNEEVAKLKEFVELAERLRSLKNDGTLDKLADTILKLS